MPRVPGMKTLRRIARQARSRREGRAVVLGYHRVAPEADDPFGMTVRPDRFAEQMEAIGRMGRPVRLEELVGSPGRESDGRGRIAVTFDDGYADLREAAIPLLQEFEIPATLFVVTGFLGRTFWWDALHGIVAAAERAAPSEPLRIGGEAHSWGERGWSDGREARLEGVYWWLRELPDSERERTLEELARWAGLPEPPAVPRALTARELVRLTEDGLLEVGSHTVTHPDLTTLDRSAVVGELAESKAELEAQLERPVVGFSYPFGAASPSVAGLIRDAGYRYACTSREDALGDGTDPFAIPRLWVPDLSGSEFRDWLRRWI